MIDIDRAVLQNILTVVPYGEWSPLLAERRGQTVFEQWCAHDPVAHRIVQDTLSEAPVFALDRDDNAFVLSVDYADAESLVRDLVTAFEDERLERLFSAY